MDILGRSVHWFPLVIVLTFALPTQPSTALPIGFGYNQGSLEFIEIRSENFTVYQDKRAVEDAKLALRSLEAARPHMERWFGTKRGSPLIVNMSAASDHASFANFVTDSIELQTMGRGGRDLAWHEYAHSTMYRHLDNWFGPAGAIIHLPWLEAWFLEGLAEAISVSIGSDEQAGVERYQALTNHWPSWDRIHSLYTSGPFNFRGYATSGAFVSWILRTHGADKLPQMLEQFKSDSMPWYWPWALMPFNDFWPMDKALRFISNKNGRQLYEQYKAEATNHWKSVINTPVLSGKSENEQALKDPWLWHSSRLIPRPTSAPPEAASYQWHQSGVLKTWITSYYPKANERRYKIALEKPPSKAPLLLPRSKATWIDGPWISSGKVHWLETSTQTMRLCSVPQDQFKSSAVSCSLETTIPMRLRYLGSKTDASGRVIEDIVIARDTESVKGDKHELMFVNANNSSKIVYQAPLGGRPISFARTNKSLWLLTSDDTWRHLIQLSPEGRCEGMITLADFPVRIIDSNTPRPHVVMYTVNGFALRTLEPDQFPIQSCRPLTSRSSPLLATIRAEKNLTLQQALDQSSIWISSKNNPIAPTTSQDPSQAKPETAVITANGESRIGNHNATSGATTTDATVQTAKWRGRPVFAFPWVGADDAMGTQIGLISVPLMDEMQNETIRATILVGINSRFPYQDITMISSRFLPTLSISGFRAQTYNGRYKRSSDGLIYSKYLEESGFHADGSIANEWKYLASNIFWGIKSSHLKPYLGPAKRVGHLNETYGGLIGSVSSGGALFANASIRARAALNGMNKVFNYDIIGASVTAGSKINDGKVELGLDGSRTRGPKRRDLQEMYQPLKTLIPGSGGGYNQTSYALSEDYGLFTPKFGENQVRGRVLATHPVLSDIDKFKGLVYLSHMDLSGFYNYGSAWRNRIKPEKSDFIAAHGYNLDLFMDNKGVNFNLGVGAGQVVGQPWQGYWTFGFDALF